LRKEGIKEDVIEKAFRRGCKIDSTEGCNQVYSASWC